MTGDRGMNSFSIQQCYIIAWRSFKKWWIPLCLISSVILVFEIVPRIILSPETNAIKAFVIESGSTIISAMKTGDVATFDSVIIDFEEMLLAYAGKLATFSAIAFPFVALLTIILLTWANAAVKDSRDGNSLGRTLYITVVHALLSAFKISAFFFCILPGFYIYVRLLFVSLILLEEKECGVDEAIRRSWIMSRGNFWNLLALVVINAFCQVMVAPTIIGLVPVTGFVNTARAAAYQMLQPA